MAKCKRKRAFPTRAAAERALERMRDREPDRLYVPVGVTPRCHCGNFHLTAKQGKVWKSGKPRRRAS